MKRTKFLKYPEFPGGTSSFRKYITENLIYPEEAMKCRIEGNVFLSAEIDDNGNIHDIRIDKGLGYGCDEEAVRLLHEMHFGGVTNPGIRLKTRKKFRIPFHIKNEKENLQINYSVKKEVPEKKKSENKIQSGTIYSYSVNWSISGEKPE